MLNVRDKINDWSKITYGEYVSSHYKKKQINAIIPIFDKLQITNKYMNGFSCEKLPKDEEGRMGLKKTYSEFFHSEIKKQDFSPASYLASILFECEKQNLDKNKYSGILARGLRSFTSLLREPDLASQLNEILHKHSGLKIELNSKQDSGDHTDILILKGNSIIRLWLYQFSSRGLPHDIERLTEKRGKLPAGIHILCPLHTEVAIDYVKYKDKSITLKGKIEQKNKEIEKCSIKAVKKLYTLKCMLEKYEAQLIAVENKVETLKKITNIELDELYGWFLYSTENANRIAKLIDSALENSSKPTSYEEVNRMLTAAERFIGSNNIFIKEDGLS